MMNLVGQTLGQYRIEALLGTGAMGQIFRGMHVPLNRPVAIRVMPATLAANPAFRARFLQDMKSTAALKHPNIVEIYEVGEQEGSLYLAMELMTGGSLRTLLQRNAGKPLPLLLGLDLVRQAAEGLAAAHAQGMVHNDVKPDTLLLTLLSRSSLGRERYLLKISDFGLARLAAESGLTTTDIPWGTPAYMSPEQCQSKSLDGRSDLYSLGVVLYEVVTGYLPFQIDNFDDAFTKHVNTPPPSPRQVRPDLPPRLEAIILRCLAKRPEERYATGTELASDLQQVLDELPPVKEVAPPAPASTPPPLVGINRIGVAVNPETLTITPGQPATIQITLTNLGNIVDWFTTAVEGVAPEWVQGPREATQLNPGMQQTIPLSINVARTAANRAQDYPVTIRARSHEHPNESNTVHGSWTVLPFKEDALGLEPRRASGRGSAAYTVTLHNGGNTPTQYELSGEDDEKQLGYRFEQTPVALDAGRDARVPMAVSSSRRWIGREQRWPFQVHARPAGSRSSLTSQGEFVNKVLIPTWLLAIVLVAVAAGIARGVLPGPDNGKDKTTPTPQVSPTITLSPSFRINNFNGCHWDSHGGVGQNVSCPYVLSNSSKASSPLNWSVSANNPNVHFSVSSGTLAPGQSITINVFDPSSCPLTDILSFQGNANPVQASMICTAISTSPNVYEFDNTKCTHNSNWNCIITVTASPVNSQDTSWSVSLETPDPSISFSPNQGKLAPGESVIVTATIRGSGCPGRSVFKFSVPGSLPDQTNNLEWSC